MRRSKDMVCLGEYATAGETAYERVCGFLQDVECATRADISGATGEAWATVHGVLATLQSDSLIVVDSTTHPWEYRWKR